MKENSEMRIVEIGDNDQDEWSYLRWKEHPPWTLHEVDLLLEEHGLEIEMDNRSEVLFRIVHRVGKS